MLKVISCSTFDLRTVFDTLVESGTRLCQASSSAIWRPKDDGSYHLAASYGVQPKYKSHLQSLSLRSDGHSVVGRSLQSGKTTYVSDVLADPEYSATRNARDFGGYRGLLAVPLMREGSAIGVLMVAHTEVQEFTEKQIALATIFADQAVIAIENTRLFNELRFLLEQQTATAEVLKVVSSSPGDLEPVFQAMLENSTRICGAKIGILFRYENGAYTAMAQSLALACRQPMRST